MNHARKAKHGWILTLFFSIVSVLYLYPIVLVVINSFKKKAYISRYPFRIPRDRMFVGLENYVRGLEKTGFLPAFGWILSYRGYENAVLRHRLQGIPQLFIFLFPTVFRYQP